MPTRSRRSVKKDVDDVLTLRKMEQTAADYVGKARAAAMAKSGYFKRQLKHQRAHPAPERVDAAEYEVRALGGALFGRADSVAAAMKLGDANAAPEYVLQVIPVGSRTPVAERLRWDAVNRRRSWDVK